MAEITLVRCPQVAREAGRWLGAALARIQARQGRVRLAIPGGSALAALQSLRPELGRDRWASLHLTWTDERCVPFAHPDSNRGEAYRRGILDPADPPASELPLFLDGETPAQACARVAAALRADFGGGLDLLLLGLGEDGHIASLFPGRELRTEPVQAVTDSPKPPAERISLGLPLLATAEEAVLAVSGEGKREALARLLRRDPALPGSALSRLTVITDLDLE